MMEDGVSSFQNRCRLCISEAKLSLNLFQTEAIRLDIINKIRTYLTIQISLHDGLPQQICYKCLSRIELFHSYKQSCLESQYTLKHWDLFCEGGKLQQDDVLNINSSSNYVEDNGDGQPEDAEAQCTHPCNQLPKKRSIIISPKSRRNQSCRASYRTSDPFEREGNSVGDCQVECSVINRVTGGLRDGAAERESIKVMERTTRSGAVCTLQANEETSKNRSPPSGQNSKIFVQNCKTQMNIPEHCSGVGIEKQRSPSLSSIQSPSESTTGSVTRFLDSTTERSATEGNSFPENEVECEVTDMSARELRNGGHYSTAKEKSVMTEAKGRSGSPVSVDCVLDSSKEAFRQNLIPLSQCNSISSVHSQRLQTYSLGSQPGVNIPIERSFSMSVLVQNPLKIHTRKVSTSDMIQFEGNENDIIDSEDKSAARESSDSSSCIAAKCESSKLELKIRDKSPLFVRSVLSINKEASKQKYNPSSLHNSRTSVQGQRVQVGIPGNQSKMEGQSRMSSIIYDAHPLVTFPDSVVKEWNIDHYCHVTDDAENLGIKNSLVEEEKNMALSENVTISSERQNESMHMDVRTKGEHVNYPSVQALLKILECDENSVPFESDIENSQDGKMLAHDTYRPPTPGPSGRKKSRSKECVRDTATAFAKVEKLAERKKGTVLKVYNMGKVKAVLRQTQKLQRGSNKKHKIQSNQYRMVKSIEDKTTGKVHYKCLKCGSLLSYKHYIKEHMKIHTGDKSFACSTCDRAFRNKYMLKSHMVVHVKEKNFECEVCNHRFVGMERLKQHMKLHSNKSFVCPMCGRSCTQKQSLQRHMRVHTGERPFKCEFCDAAFADRTTWINHRRIHTGERPFECRECKKTFSRSVNLLAHKTAAHSDVRAFGCQLCVNRFKTKAHLVKHLSCIHKDLMKSVVNFMKEEQSHK